MSVHLDYGKISIFTSGKRKSPLNHAKSNCLVPKFLNRSKERIPLFFVGLKFIFHKLFVVEIDEQFPKDNLALTLNSRHKYLTILRTKHYS